MFFGVFFCSFFKIPLLSAGRMRFLKIKNQKNKKKKLGDQFLTYKKANLGPVFNSTAYIHIHIHTYIHTCVYILFSVPLFCLVEVSFCTTVLISHFGSSRKQNEVSWKVACCTTSGVHFCPLKVVQFPTLKVVTLSNFHFGLCFPIFGTIWGI